MMVARGWLPEDGCQRMVARGWLAQDGWQRMVDRGWSAEDGWQRVVDRGWLTQDKYLEDGWDRMDGGIKIYALYPQYTEISISSAP